MASDGSVLIETRIDTGNVRRDVQNVNRELDNIGSNMGRVSRDMRNTFGTELAGMSRDVTRGYSQISAESRRMTAEMSAAFKAQKSGLGGVYDEQIKIEYGYFKLAQASATWTGSTKDMIAQAKALGAAQKAANDAAINSNRLAMMGMLETIGVMQNMTTQAQRISDTYKNMANPIYNVNRAGLALADTMNRVANNGSSAQLALELLGPTASMKDLNNTIAMINQGVMRMQMVTIAAAASCVLAYSQLWKAAKGPDPKTVYAAQEQALAEYQQAVEERTQAIMESWNLFEKVQLKSTSAEQLTANLQEQVNILENWKNNLTTIAERAGQEFSNYLAQMGPQSAAEIQAIATMSEPELQNYVNLWQQKMSLARTQSENELEQLKASTDQKIKELQDSLTPLGLAWEELKNTFVSAIQPMVEAFGMIMTPLVEMVNKFFELVEAFNQANPTLALFIQGTMMLIPALTLLLSPLAIGIGMFKGFRAAMSAVWMIIGPLVTGLAAMSGTVLIVAAAVMGFILVITYLWNTNEQFKNAVINAWNYIKEQALLIWTALKDEIIIPIWTAVSTFLQEIWTTIQTFWDENGQQILEATRNVWNFISEVVRVAMDVINAIMQVVWPIIVALVESTWGAIKGLISGALDVILGFVKFFSALFTGDWEGMWEAVKQIWNGALEALWGYLQLFGIGKVLKFLGKFVDDIIKWFKKLWGTSKQIWNNALTEIWFFFSSKFEAISNFAKSIGNSIKSTFSDMWNNVKSLFSDGVKAAYNFVKDGFNQMLDFVKDLGKKFYNAGKDVIQGLIDGMKSMAKNAVAAVKDIGNGIVEGVKSFFSIHSPSRVMYGFGEFVTEGLANGIFDMKDYAVKAAVSMSQQILNAFKPLKDDIEIGGLVLGDNKFNMDSVQDEYAKLTLPSSQDMINSYLNVPQVEPSVKQVRIVEDKPRTNNAQQPQDKQPQQPPVIVMDKRVVGEVLSSEIDEVNQRKSSRYAQFSPTTVPSF